jgi:hypothetical protein
MVSTIVFNAGVGNMKKQRWFGLAIGLMGAILVICLPVILPLVLVLQALDYRRMRSAARKFPCLSCGSHLGAEAIRLADEAWQQYFSNMRANNPTIRFRIVRHLRAICPRCGRRYDFVEPQRTFAALVNDGW